MNEKRCKVAILLTCGEVVHVNVPDKWTSHRAFITAMKEPQNTVMSFTMDEGDEMLIAGHAIASARFLND